jgi:hypothetical protein
MGRYGRRRVPPPGHRQKGATLAGNVKHHPADRPLCALLIDAASPGIVSPVVASFCCCSMRPPTHYPPYDDSLPRDPPPPPVVVPALNNPPEGKRESK